jgi:peptidyl-prolyl cis-trans isomerase SurA
LFTCRRFVATVILCLCAVAGAQAAELTVNKIVAVVNGEMITLHELKMHVAAELARRRLKPDDPSASSLQATVLDSLINDILFRQEAKRFKVTVSDADVETEVKNSISRSGIPADKFEPELKRQGISMEMYRDRIRNNLLRQRMSSYMVQRKVFVTQEEVADYYHRHRDEFSGEKTADFSILLLPEKVDAQSIYKQVSSGKMTFEEAARQHSADRSGGEGGRVGGVPYNRLPPEMQKLLSSLQDGKMSPLLRTQGGFVVIRRNAVSEAKPLTMEEAKPRIEEILLAPLLEERFKDYVSQLRGKAVIDIRN